MVPSLPRFPPPALAHAQGNRQRDVTSQDMNWGPFPSALPENMANIIAKATEVAHSAAVSLATVSQIKIGQELPPVPLKENEPNSSVSIHNLPGRIILVGVPGAFTPTCSSQAPGYIENYEKFTAKGIQGIYVISVNDAFVTKAWKAKLSGDKETSVRFLADDKASFSGGLGLTFDATAGLGGIRAQRFVLVVNDGKVENIFVEPDASKTTITAAEEVLAKL
ncbi:Redoxin-domain-containing protein [Cantharellus anzutake]|uniref:Redoxin-domain-containing protein n=1 Tax=Cantharellus anzutake TaxID=1750568 RepID=UPI001904625B|nr:Redoxin-domain-containing protein [Cantharellus anzutake]KAF8326681.1 Redoxin-domain-containing protein [Cantharellus anzutake]